ncbi:DUF4055 domain-containing protein [Nitratireductor aquimarinus]|uniref:DUF4055 domain-containing protein n=1 Tax=Nitratireductor aquimarinus TaxID=889300 RepID=UPI003B58BE8E
MADTTSTQPNNTSSDYDAMLPYWTMIDDIMGGAKTMRAAKEHYLPRFEKEDREEYEARVRTAPWTPLYSDAFRNLASKPFNKELALDENAHDDLKTLSENIDAAGNHIHVFARKVFEAGINNAIDWIWIGHTDVPEGASVATRKALKARPYWTRIPAKRMLAVYEDVVEGEVLIVHARFDESIKRRVGFGEETIERVRVLDRERIETVENGVTKVGYGQPTYQLWERKEVKGRRSATWAVIEEGRISIDVIPLVPFVVGDREVGSFEIRPPLRDLAYMQVTEFQMESDRKRVQTMTAFPVSVFRGVEAPDDGEKVTLGPRAAFFFPPAGEGGQLGDFKFAEPSGAAGTMLREDLTEFRREMREAGMQPLTKFSGSLTATEVMVNDAKAHSAVEMWALALKDALEQAFVITCKWLGLSEKDHPNVKVNTDFAIGAQTAEEMGLILQMYEKGLISADQVIDEALRRNIIGPDYDRDEDLKRIIEQITEAVEDQQAAMPPGDQNDEEEEDQTDAA